MFIHGLPVEFVDDDRVRIGIPMNDTTRFFTEIQYTLPLPCMIIDERKHVQWSTTQAGWILFYGNHPYRK
jgi:hypothetical protein